MSSVGDLVGLKEEFAREFYYVGAEKDLGVGIVLSEFVTPNHELFFEVSWSAGHREYIRPSWLRLVKKNPSNS
jgi:hypothetical protein